MAVDVSAQEWINGLGIAVFGLDDVGQVTFWNKAAESLTGYCADEVICQPLSSLLHACRSVIEQILTGHVSEHRLTVTTKSRKTICLKIKTAQQKCTVRGEERGLVCFAEEAPIPNGNLGVSNVYNGVIEQSLEVNEISALIFGIDKENRLNIWNNTAVEVFGFSRDEAFGTDVLDLLCQSRRGKELLADAINNTRCSNKRMELFTKSGEYRLVLLSKSQRPNGVVFVGQDITPFVVYDQSVEDSLYQMMHELRELIDRSNAPMFGLDINGDVNEWNWKMVEITGYSKNLAFEQNFLETFIIPSLRQSVREIFENGLKGVGTSNFQLEFRTINNEIRFLLLNVSTRRDIAGDIVGVLCIAEDVTEAAHHDRAVAAMACELRQLVDTANAPIFGIDVDGNVNEWNGKTAEITGFSGDEAFNRPLVDTFIAPKYRGPLQEVLDNALNGIGTSNYELEFRTKSNENRYLLVNATTRRDAENKIVGVVGVAQDVTEAAKHDRAVAAMANELRQLIDTANAPIFGIDVDGDVNEWNDKTAEITGYSKEEAFDCALVDTFIVPSLRESVQEVMDNALEGRGTSNYELEFRTKTNEIRHLLVNATTRRDAESNVVGVVGVAQDVTEAVHRDRAVAGMANELRQLIETANAPIFGIDVEGYVNEWNKKTAEITGFTKEDAFDEPLAKFIAPSMRNQVQAVMNKALVGNATSNYELEIVSKSGEVRVLRVNATTRRDPDNNIVGVVGVAQDVTEDRKHAKELREMQYLRASQAAKVETERNMTAYFAHELRNPLGAIDSALNALPDDLPESAKSLVAGMQLCTGFMSSIMNNLLDVRKMEEGKMTLKLAAISLRDNLNSIHKMLLPSVRPNVQFLAICETKGKDWVQGDAHRIQQILTNVITNAIKYTVSGSITLSMRWEGKFVRFECHDTGPGIPKSEQQKLFERYVQRGGAPGTGLGLAIAKHLVDLMGGSVHFDSDPALRPGTSCVVLMPLPFCAAPDIIMTADDKPIESILSFLIIDDVKMNRMMLKRRLEKGIAPNSVVKEASTGEEALLICGKEKFDVIVVDQYMEEAGGVMVGTDVVFAMRRMRIESVIIGCSGNEMDEQFTEAGADFVWKKPMPSNANIISDIRAAMASRNKQV